MAGRRCSVVAVLVFFAALAGPVVRGYVTKRQGCQYMLVNGVLTSLSRAVCRLNGLGRRGLDPMLPGAAPGRGLTSPQLRSGRPSAASLCRSARSAARERSYVRRHGTSQSSQLLVWQGRQGLFPSFECNLTDSVSCPKPRGIPSTCPNGRYQVNCPKQAGHATPWTRTNMSYHPYWTDGSPQSLRPDGMTSLPGSPLGGPQASGPQSRGPPTAGPDGPRIVSRIAWGGCHEWQRSIRSVRNPG